MHFSNWTAWRRIAGSLIAAGALSGFLSTPASAHAFGDRYDLPIPLYLLTTSAAAVVVLSFVVMGLFLRHAPAGRYPRFNLLSTGIGRALAHPALLGLLRFVFAAIFALILATGFFGTENPSVNFSVVMVWIVAWVGMAFISALFGNLWAIISPWNTIYLWLEKMFGGLRRPRLICPEWVNAWPAVILFWIFAWMEVAWDNAADPGSLAIALSVYSVITWIGMTLFGREEWQRRGEFFAVLYSLFSRFAITETRVLHAGSCETCTSFDSRQDAVGCEQGITMAPIESRQWNLRPPGIGLITNRPPPTAYMIIILAVLASVTFDGFTETESWRNLAVTVFEQIRPMGQTAIVLIELMGVYGFPAVFILAYLLVIFLIALSGGRLDAYWDLARIFSYSIVPIVIGYHLSHNFTQVLVEGQYTIAQVSDPFGFGWDLFGTAKRQVEIGVIDAQTFWFLSVTSIVVGHVVAVYIAHAEALAFFGDRNKALLSQIPMIVLMAAYTMISLWIIAQPVVI